MLRGTDLLPAQKGERVPRYKEVTDNPKFIVIDLFCGFGGTTLGFEKAMYVNGRGELVEMAKVVACVNHDPKAIKSHWKNHPEVYHFEEDIRTLNLDKLLELVAYYRQLYPNAKVILWASLECTNYSKAKGGLPRDADSRTLPLSLYRYILGIKPDYVMIENVVEFMSWGPMRIKCKKRHKDRSDLWLMKDKKTGEPCYGMEPISKKNGQEWIKWRQTIKSFGYDDDWKELNSADFGAYTSRNRLFGMFAKKGLPIAWPEATHAKQPNAAYGFLSPLLKWKPVKEVLNFEDEGESIFNREFNLNLRKQDRHDLVENTLARIYAGLLKFVAGMNEKAFIAKYYSGRPEGKVTSLESPAGTIPTAGNQAYVNCSFLVKNNGGSPNDKVVSIEGPTGALTTVPQQTFINCQPLPDGLLKGQIPWIIKYNSVDQKSGKHVPPSVDDPAPVISTQGRIGLAQAFIYQNNSGDPNAKIVDTEGPARVLTGTAGNQHLAKINYLTLHYTNGGNLADINSPAPVLPTKDRITSVTAIKITHHLDKKFTGPENHQSVDQPLGTVMPKDKYGIVRTEQAFIQRDFGSGGGQHSSIEQPAGGVTTVPKLSIIRAERWILDTNYQNVGSSIEDPHGTIVASRKHHYLLNPQYKNSGGDPEQPCFTLIAKMDKKPPQIVTPLFVTTDQGDFGIIIYDTDSPYTKKIKEFMAIYGIIDIKMRMLRVPELLKIQGFPEDYQMVGSQADKKKFIGNSVVPEVVKVWAEALGDRYADSSQLKIA